MRAEIERLKIKFERANADVSELREDYKQIFCSKVGKCPTCGQNLPLEKFNATKDKKIAEISVQGKQLKIECEKLASEISAKSAEVERLKAEAEKNSIAIESFASMEELNAAIAERDKIIAQNTDATNKYCGKIHTRESEND